MSTTLTLCIKTLIRATFLISLLLLGGCASSPFSSLSAGKVYPSLPTMMQNKVQYSVLERTNSLQFRDMVYLRLSNHSTISSDEFEQYAVAAVKSMGFFHHVAASTPSVQINTVPDEVRKIGKKYWFDRKDHYSMKQLKERFGSQDMLVLDMVLRETTPSPSGLATPGKNLSFDVNVVELKSGKTLFYAQSQGSTALGVDKTLVNPVLNRVKQWLDDNAIASQYF